MLVSVIRRGLRYSLVGIGWYLLLGAATPIVLIMLAMTLMLVPNDATFHAGAHLLQGTFAGADKIGRQLSTSAVAFWRMIKAAPVVSGIIIVATFLVVCTLCEWAVAGSDTPFHDGLRVAGFIVLALCTCVAGAAAVAACFVVCVMVVQLIINAVAFVVGLVLLLMLIGAAGRS